MSYAEIVLATVPDAPPARKNQRAVSWPAPISAKVPYLRMSRLIWSAFVCALGFSSLMEFSVSCRPPPHAAQHIITPHFRNARLGADKFAALHKSLRWPSATG